MIGAVLHYCKNLCQALNVEFSRHTIVVTALTGAAAVNINGETTSRACKLNKNRNNIEKCDFWAEETCMVIVDEISFCSQDDLTTLNDNLNILCDKPLNKLFGDCKCCLLVISVSSHQSKARACWQKISFSGENK